MFQGKCQRGFSVVFLSIFIVVAGIVLLGAARYQIVAASKTAGKIVGGAINNINEALGGYQQKFRAELVSGLPIAGVVNPYSPTIAELVNMRFLTATFSNTAPHGGGYGIIIAREPVACTAATCNLVSQVWTTNPLLNPDNGLLDIRRLGAAIAEIGANGGFSTDDDPATIGGAGGWTRPNNAGSVAGILMAINGFGASGYDLTPYFRTDGTKQLIGNADANGYSWSNLQRMTATSTVTGGEFTTPLLTEGAVCATANSLAMGNGVILICRDGTWQIYKGEVATAGTACAPDGRAATSSSTNEELVCKNSIWIRQTSLITKNIEISRRIVTDGTIVPKPTCDVGGVPDYSFHVIQTTVDLTTAPPKQAFYVTTVDLGPSWRVEIKLRDDFANIESGNTYGLSEVMRLECKY